MISIGFVALAVTALVVVLAGSGARRRGEGCGMRRFWTAVLMIGVVFALNVTLRFPHTARHHRTLLPPKPPAAPAPPVIEVWNDDNAPVKVAVGPKITWTRGRVAKPAPAVAPTPAPPAAPQVVEWQVTGEPRETKEEAWQSALEKAQAVLTAELHLHAPLDPEVIQNKMVQGAPKEDTLNLGGNLGTAKKITLDLELKPEVRDELARVEREYRVEERMTWLARLMAAAVVLLGAVGAYVRLDDWTKGYYTGWLRLALGLGAAAAATGAWFVV